MTSGYSGRLTVYVAMSCMVAASGGLLFGYDLGISGGVSSMDSFLKAFFPDVYAKSTDAHFGNYCKFDSQLLTTFTSSLYIAGLFASLLASHITSVFGNRAAIIAGGVVFLAGAAMGGGARNVYMLILSRVLLGVGIGFTNLSVPMYLSEIAPPQHRGALTNVFELCVSSGILVANLINYGAQKIESGWGWRISLASAAAPAALLTIGTLFLPDTPAYILRRSGELQKATVLLQRIRGTTNVQRELDDLIAASEVSKTHNHPFRLILQRRYRPQLVMAIAIPIFQQMTGNTVITFYSPIVFRTMGLKESASLLSAVVTRVVGLSFNIVAVMAVDKLGRRILFIAGGIQMLISHIILGVVLATQLGDYGMMKKGYAYFVFIMICIYLAGFACSWGPLGWLVPSEIFPLEIRSAGMSIVVAVGFLTLFVLSQSILTMLCHLKYGVFFLFGGCVLGMTVFVWAFLPETKGVPMERMEMVWKGHWFWRKYVGDGGEERIAKRVVMNHVHMNA